MRDNQQHILIAQFRHNSNIISRNAKGSQSQEINKSTIYSFEKFMDKSIIVICNTSKNIVSKEDEKPFRVAPVQIEEQLFVIYSRPLGCVFLERRIFEGRLRETVRKAPYCWICAHGDKLKYLCRFLLAF